MRIEKYFFFFEIHESDLDSVDVTKFDHFSIKIGKLGWMEYIDKDIFTELTYLSFYLEHKVTKYCIYK